MEITIEKRKDLREVLLYEVYDFHFNQTASVILW